MAFATTPPNLCRDLPQLSETDGLPPDAWPAYPGRCLDQGSKRENLLDRARRCVVEEPEDPAPILLLGHLGDATDVPVLEALALREMNPQAAVESLARLDPEAARPALVRLACHARRPDLALKKLAATPRPEEWRIYADHVRSGPEFAVALGRLALPEGREVLLRQLMASSGNDTTALVGLLQDPSAEAVESVLELRAEPARHVQVVRLIPEEHPAFRQVLTEASVSSEPTVRAAAVSRVDTWDDSAGASVLRQALNDEAPQVRTAAARWLAREEERFEDLDAEAGSLDDPERALVYHRERIQRGDGTSADALQALREIPETRWEAMGAWLSARVVPEEQRIAMAKEVVHDITAPPRVRTAATSLLAPREGGARQPDVELLDLTGGKPGFSRERLTVRDGKRLANRARKALDDDIEDNDAFGLAVLPWVGDDSDIDRLAGDGRGPRTHPLADLGTPAALDRMATSPSNHLPWAWSRTDRGWSELQATVTDEAQLVGIVRPEAYAIALRATEERGANLRAWIEPTDRRAWTVRQQRQSFHHQFRDRPGLPSAKSLAEMEEKMLPLVARHAGHRWILLAALDDLPAERRSAALDALVEANWWGERAPQVVVDAAKASTSRGAWRLRIALGDTTAALEAAQGPQRRAKGNALAAVVDALSAPDPPPELFGPVAAWVRSGDMYPMLVGTLLRAPSLHPVVKQALLSGEIPLREPCDALKWIDKRSGLEMGDAWIVDTLMECGRNTARPRLDRERMVELQQQMLSRDLTDEQVRIALSLDRRDPDVVRPFLDRDDPGVRSSILHTMDRAGIPEGELPRVLGWAEGETDGSRSWGGGALRVLLKHAPEVALPMLTADVAAQDDWHAAAALKRIGTDEAMAALIPILERGTSRRVEEIGRWVKDHGGPVYEAHRALVDGLVTPSWKRTP